MYKVNLVEGISPSEGIKKKSACAYLIPPPLPLSPESTQYQTVQVHAGPQGQLSVVRAW